MDKANLVFIFACGNWVCFSSLGWLLPARYWKVLLYLFCFSWNKFFHYIEFSCIWKMEFVSTLLGLLGFGFGISAGILLGYFLFIYFQSSEEMKVNSRIVTVIFPNYLDFLSAVIKPKLWFFICFFLILCWICVNPYLWVHIFFSQRNAQMPWIIKIMVFIGSIIRELDPKTLQRLMLDIPLWLKSPDYDRVCGSFIDVALVLRCFFHYISLFYQGILFLRSQHYVHSMNN